MQDWVLCVQYVYERGASFLEGHSIAVIAFLSWQEDAAEHLQ